MNEHWLQWYEASQSVTSQYTSAIRSTKPDGLTIQGIKDYTKQPEVLALVPVIGINFMSTRALAVGVMTANPYLIALGVAGHLAIDESHHYETWKSILS